MNNQELTALREQLTKQQKFNSNAREAIDKLLEEAGYTQESSCRNLLACMNFSVPEIKTLPKKPLGLSKEQMLEKYGSVAVSFINYYKYSFHYKAELPDDKTLYATYSGCDEIYKHEVKAGEAITLNELNPTSVIVYRHEGNTPVELYEE